MPEQPERHEFKVLIEGITLSPETIDSIDQAIRQTVMHELASIDLNESLAFTLPRTLAEDEELAGRFAFLPDPLTSLIKGLHATPVSSRKLFF